MDNQLVSSHFLSCFLHQMGPQDVALTLNVHETALSCSVFSVSYCEFMLPKNVIEIHRMEEITWEELTLPFMAKLPYL